jgi:hypothetical protein
MTYEEIKNDHRPRVLPASHPHLATIVITADLWHRFENLVGDTPATRILGYTGPDAGFITAFVGCASESVRDRLEEGWN